MLLNEALGPPLIGDHHQARLSHDQGAKVSDADPYQYAVRGGNKIQVEFDAYVLLLTKVIGRVDDRADRPLGSHENGLSRYAAVLSGKLRQRVQVYQLWVFLNWAAFKEVDQFDNQDHNHHQLKNKGAGLIELLDHEAVEVFGRMELFLDQVFVIGNSDLLGA